MAEGNGEQNLDAFLNEDSDDDIETSPDIIGEEYNVLFGSEDDESEFEGFQESFSPTKNTNRNNIGNNVNNNDEQSAVSKKNPDADAPAGFKIAK